MKVKALIVSALVVAGGVGMAAPAGAGEGGGNGYGKTIQACLGTSYGQALKTIREDPAHEGVFPPASGAKKVVELVAAGGHPCVD